MSELHSSFWAQPRNSGLWRFQMLLPNRQLRLYSENQFFQEKLNSGRQWHRSALASRFQFIIQNPPSKRYFPEESPAFFPPPLLTKQLLLRESGGFKQLHNIFGQGRKKSQLVFPQGKTNCEFSLWGEQQHGMDNRIKKNINLLSWQILKKYHSAP